MKKLILTSVTVLFTLAAFAQDSTAVRKWYKSEFTPGGSSPRDIMFEVRGTYLRPVKKEVLNEAKLISDICPGYPVNWIEYVSTEIAATCNGTDMKAAGVNNMLSAEQSNILNIADIGTNIFVNVKYKSRNAATDYIETREINTCITVIPEKEAEYVGGYVQLAKYLNEKVIHKISETKPAAFQQGEVRFTVNEQGEIINAKISRTTRDAKTDKLMLEAIKKMPNWKPAGNSKGLNVKQDFLFSVGNDGC